MNEGEEADSVLPLTSASDVTNSPSIIVPTNPVSNDANDTDSATVKMTAITPQVLAQKPHDDAGGARGRNQTNHSGSGRSFCCLLL
jgi:hypothetical protein